MARKNEMTLTSLLSWLSAAIVFAFSGYAQSAQLVPYASGTAFFVSDDGVAVTNYKG
jgi:hypothetical protein